LPPVRGPAEGLEAVEQKVDGIRQDLSRYKGVVGGIMWVGAMAWAVVTTFKDQWR
jgi:hypothetical protein